MLRAFTFKEKIKQLQQALSRAQDEIKHLRTTSQQKLQEMDNTIAIKSAEEIQLKERLENSKKKYEEEIASLRQALKGMCKMVLFCDCLIMPCIVTIEESEADKLHLERELLKLKTSGRARSPSLETSMLQVSPARISDRE